MGRGVDVVVGFSFWEAEAYVEVCEMVLEVCLITYLHLRGWGRGCCQE